MLAAPRRPCRSYGVPEPLHALLSTAPGLSHCLPMSAATLPAVDVYCPINSLPLAFKTKLETIPLPVNLSAPFDLMGNSSWEKRLGARDRLRVGLVWSVPSDASKNDQSRSIALRLLTRILDIDATFLSLQRDPRSDDKALLLERADIVDLTEHLADFSETAALVGCLDLVITVDTSVAHLAGTMGCPTWVLLPYTPDHRWLLDRATTAPGIRPCGCSGRGHRAVTPKSSIACGRNWRRWHPGIGRRSCVGWISQRVRAERGPMTGSA